MEYDVPSVKEMEQTIIDQYVMLLRIKKAEKSVNEELDYQIRVYENKLHVLGINTEDYKQ